MKKIQMVDIEVICINNEGLEFGLTLNRKYKITHIISSDTFNSYLLIGDDGGRYLFSSTKFVQLYEIRDNKIKSILC